MQTYQISDLVKEGVFPCDCKRPKMVETHISWVILCEKHAYKIKKPIKYSFLDFSSLQKRKYYLERELFLNHRYTKDVYLQVLPIYLKDNILTIGGKDGVLVDFTLQMRRIKDGLRMDKLLLKKEVSKAQIDQLAEIVADFHLNARTVYNIDGHLVDNNFDELAREVHFINKEMGSFASRIANDALALNHDFHQQYYSLFEKRKDQGWIKDLHGDLHSRNIFLEKEPVIFDCIEFNDQYRIIDVLNEIAFLCMDLEAYGAPELSERFLTRYLDRTGYVFGEEERLLFNYFKAYRANVRAKVNLLRARSETSWEKRKPLFAEVERYLYLMNDYLSILPQFDKSHS